MTRTNRAAAGAATGYLQFVLQVVLQFMLAPLVLLYAGRETLGAYAVLGQVVGYVALLDLGFTATFSRFLSNSTGIDDGGRRYALVLTTGRTFVTGVNAAMGIACLVLAWIIGPMLGLSEAVAIDARWGLTILGIWNCLRGPMMASGTALTANQQLAFRNLLTALTSTWRLVVSLVLVWAGLGLLGLMLAQVSGELIDAVACHLRYRRRYGSVGLGWGVPDRALFREMLTFGFRALLINVAVRLALFSDQIVVGIIAGAEAGSVYYSTQMPAVMGWVAVWRIVDSAAPAVNQLEGQGAREAQASAFLRLHRYTLYLSLPLAMGILLFNPSFIGLWVGAEQYGGSLLNVSLAVFALMICTSHVSAAFVMASGDIRVTSRLAIVEGVLNVCLSVVLGIYLGLGGVMLATVACHLITATYVQLKAQRRLGLAMTSVLRVAVVPCLLPALVSFMTAVAYVAVVGVEGWARLLVGMATFVVIHGVAVFLFSIDRADRLLMSGALGYAGVVLTRLRRVRK